MTLTISELRQAHKLWFSRENMGLAGDLEYRILHSKAGTPYLVIRTFGFSDMFTGVRTAHYRLNCIGPDLQFVQLEEEVFPTLQAVKAWLKS
jgi:hypothetical protein